MIYWDTSALIKLYTPEADSEAYYRQLVGQKPKPAISDLHRVEMYYALQAKESRGEIAAGSGARLALSFDRHVTAGRYFTIPWGADVIEGSRRILDQCLASDPSIPIRSLDGIHLGAVLAAGVSRVVTADLRMKAAAAAAGIEVIEPM